MHVICEKVKTAFILTVMFVICHKYFIILFRCVRVCVCSQKAVRISCKSVAQVSQRVNIMLYSLGFCLQVLEEAAF